VGPLTPRYEQLGASPALSDGTDDVRWQACDTLSVTQVLPLSGSPTPSQVFRDPRKRGRVSNATIRGLSDRLRGVTDRMSTTSEREQRVVLSRPLHFAI
jgi:hypothetical protein